MEAPSVQKLCEQLISHSIYRCRVSADFCRLSVVIRRLPDVDLPNFQISISDTGVGSTLDEFHGFKNASDGFSAPLWDGILSIITTSISDDVIFQYKLNLNETSSRRRVIKLPSLPKNNAKFSGSEVSLSSTEDIDTFVAGITLFLQKILMLKPPNLAVEVVAESGVHSGSQHENIILKNDCALPLSAFSSLEQLNAGLQDYVLRHRHLSTEKCQSCFPNIEHLKTGKGQALSEIEEDNQVILEYVIIISESSEVSSSRCLRANNMKTKVLYFKDFSPGSIQPSVSNALKNADWNSYGLALKSIIVDHGGSAVLEWENLPLNHQIDIALHCYNKQMDRPPLRRRTKLEGKLTKKAVNDALHDMRQTYTGYFLSARAMKICDHAPELAKSIAGLILSSGDYAFRNECFSLLRLDAETTGMDVVENCIKEKLISVIEMSDGKNSGYQKEATPFLFDADPLPVTGCQYDESEEGEDGFSYMDS